MKKLNVVTVSGTKNPYKVDQIRVTLSPNKKEEVLWVQGDSTKDRS
jgi:hypothetical protein